MEEDAEAWKTLRPHVMLSLSKHDVGSRVRVAQRKGLRPVRACFDRLSMTDATDSASRPDGEKGAASLGLREPARATLLLIVSCMPRPASRRLLPPGSAAAEPGTAPGRLLWEPRRSAAGVGGGRKALGAGSRNAEA
ncbi:MAG: hypothetical protein AMXMBFR61_25140 [Fimbriimonadales bacterium]